MNLIKEPVCRLRGEYTAERRIRMETAPCYGEEYTLRKRVPMDLRLRQNAKLDGKMGYID